MTKILLLILAIITVIVIIDYLQTRRLIKIGVAQTEQATAFEHHPPSPDHHFLVIGDSSAVGVGAATPKDSVAGRLSADFPTADISNLGVSGSKTADLIPRFEKLDSHEQYDLILIQIGGNDIVRRTPYQDLERDLPRVLTLAQQHSDNIVLVTSGNVGTSRLLPFGTRWFFTLRTRKVRKIFMNITERHNVHYVDLYRPRALDPYAQDTDRYYSPDYFHPSADGYGDWYTFIKAVIDTIPQLQK